MQLRHLDQLDTTIATVSEKIEVRLRPFAEVAERLMPIPGVGLRTAPDQILTEVGPIWTAFPRELT